MFDWLVKALGRNAEAIVVSVIISSMVSHWFSIRRDRRLEFNEVSDALDRKIVISEQGDYVYVDFKQPDIDNYFRRASWYRRRVFHKALNDYRTEISKDEYQPGSGTVVQKGDRAKMRNAAKRLKKVLRRL